MRLLQKFDAAYFKKQKRRFWRKVWLEAFLCAMTLFYFGIPVSPKEMLFRILQTIVASLCGAAMYASLSVIYSLSEEEKQQKELEHLLNGRNFQ